MNTITVDRTQKEDVVYIRDNTLNITKDKKNTIKIEDMYNFIKDDLYLAQYKQAQEEIEQEYDMEGFPIPQVIEEVQELGFLGQDLLMSENPVVDFILNAEQAMRQNTTLSCNQDNYISILAGALKQAILKIEELETTVKQIQKEG